MGTDSRSTVLRSDKRPQVFDGVKKLFVLHKDYPLAVMSWGLNRLNNISLEQLIVPIRARLEGKDPEHLDWKVDLNQTTLPEIAERVTNELFHEHYQKQEHKLANPAFSTMNLNFAGYSPGKQKPEHVEYSLTPDHIVGPNASHGDVQVNYSGGPYVSRMLMGSDPALAKKLADDDNDQEKIKKALRKFGNAAMQELIPSSIPLHQAATLVRTALNTEINLRQLGPEPDTVGGDIQMAVIDRNGCREMRFKPISFDIPQNVWNRR